MPKLVGPMMSLDASGTLGGCITYTKWKGQKRVRMWASPYQPRTDAQKAQRICFYRAVCAWHSLLAAPVLCWNNYADSVSTQHKPLSGFNLFVGEYTKLCDFPDCPPTCVSDSPYA